MNRLSVRLWLLACLCLLPALSLLADPIRVLVWDEQQPKQKEAYANFLGNHIAAHLEKHPELSVKTARLEDPEQGLSSKALAETDVLVYWGHVRHGEVLDERAAEIAERVKRGELAFLVLHSAHWSKAFMATMDAKAAQDALERLSEADRKQARVTFIGERKWKKRRRTDREHLGSMAIRHADGSIEVQVERPNCVFPTCCHEAEPSLTRTLMPEHPIAEGLPETFTLPVTEMYDEPFGVPEPDAVIFRETWTDGEVFRSGALWNVGKGKVFYYRPGHENYRIFHEEYALKIVENTALWLGKQVEGSR